MSGKKKYTNDQANELKRLSRNKSYHKGKGSLEIVKRIEKEANEVRSNEHWPNKKAA